MATGYDPNQSAAAQQPAQQMDWLREQERVDGVRFVWNCWPYGKSDPSRLILPLGVFLSPLKSRPDLPSFNYEPVHCSACRGVLNPYCQTDFRAKTWICCVCGHRNGFPASYAGISEQQRPAELLPQFTTMEYTLQRPSMAPIILFVMDTCMEEDELDTLKKSLIDVVNNLPKHTLVGLITYGKNVSVHDLSMEEIRHSFVFRGTKDVSPKDLQDQLGIGRYAGSGSLQQPGSAPQAQPNRYPNRFIQPIETCGKYVVSSIESVLRDPWPTPAGKRPLRSTGSALAIAVGLMESSFPGTGGRIMLFVGGPCTQGPGTVVTDEFKNPIRSYLDLIKDNAPFVRKATKFYAELAQRAVSNAHAIDIFSCALDQTGLHEMKSCCNLSGGQMLLGDSFDSSLFTQNLQLFFRLDNNDQLPIGFNSSTEVKVSKNIKVSGCLGLNTPSNVVNGMVSDTNMMGTGGTAEWKAPSLFPYSNYCFFFETVGPESGTPGEPLYIQFITTYQHSSGQKRVRVTTAARSWVDYASPNLAAGFDQEAAAVMMSRIACTRIEGEGGHDVQRWLDRSLIKICNKFGRFGKDDPNSFQLPDNFALLPVAIFHLRRSQLLLVANTSLDESAFYRHCLLRQDVISSLIMIQPVLYAYSLQGPPMPVALDSSSLQPDRILLLDTFFHIVIHRGETIMQWINAGYDKMPEYANLAHLIQAPVEDAQLIMSARFPIPRYVLTEHGGSQDRFLLAKVNPTHTQSNAMFGWGGQEAVSPVLTEDVNLQVFMEHLRKLAVSSSLN